MREVESQNQQKIELLMQEIEALRTLRQEDLERMKQFENQDTETQELRLQLVEARNNLDDQLKRAALNEDELDKFKAMVSVRFGLFCFSEQFPDLLRSMKRGNKPFERN